MTLVANARMYAVNATVGALWRALLERVSTLADVGLDVIEHAPPAPLAALWRRDDIGAVAMCGYPLATWRGGARPVPIAALVPRAFGAPVYRTDIVVRADSPFLRDDDLAGMRFGWTIADSQSGYQAPRRHFAERALARGGRFFAATTGPLVTPRAVVNAIFDGTIDAGPLDGYWHALLRRHEPATAAALRVVATTEAAPAPCFVAAAATPASSRRSIARAFAAAESQPALRATLDALDLVGFAAVDTRAYETLAERAHATDVRGYAELR